jgi:hypothetical protein
MHPIGLLQCRQFSAGERGRGHLSVEFDGRKLMSGFSSAIASLAVAEDASRILYSLRSNFRYGRGQAIAEQVQ